MSIIAYVVLPAVGHIFNEGGWVPQKNSSAKVVLIATCETVKV
jgi:hypothetical protein